MTDVLCLGEIIVDWISTAIGQELDVASQFTKSAGGAPANTAIGLSRLGISTSFIGRVSNDEFGLWLLSILKQNGVDTASTIIDYEAQTRMAYVVTTHSGDRKLAEFSKINCADERLQESDLNLKKFTKASMLHFGSISLINNPAKDTTLKAIHLAKQNNMLVSYDPNVRISLWKSAEICRQAILDTLHLADIVKINEDELLFLTGSKDLHKANEIRERYNLSLLIITLDARGSYICTKSTSKIIQGFKINLIEATGAGDGFNAGILSGILSYVALSDNRKNSLNNINIEQLSEIVLKANAIGALTCTKAGAITALPNNQEIEHFLLGNKGFIYKAC